MSKLKPSTLIRRAANAAVATAKRLGLKPRAIIPVDLFGLPADHDAIAAVAERHDLLVLDDAAQSFGATYRGRKLGAIGPATATSFFPAKPLGCYGDGGAIFTDDGDLAARLRSLRVHGESTDKYDAVRIGITGRLDSIQAAILLEKLKIFPDEIVARNVVAQRYTDGLAGLATVPRVGNELTSVWAQYTIRLAPGRRDALAAALKAQGIPTAIYYAKPLHRQAAYRDLPGGGRRRAGQRAAGGRSHQPADARLSRGSRFRTVSSQRFVGRWRAAYPAASVPSRPSAPHADARQGRK